MCYICNMDRGYAHWFTVFLLLAFMLLRVSVFSCYAHGVGSVEEECLMAEVAEDVEEAEEPQEPEEVKEAEEVQVAEKSEEAVKSEEAKKVQDADKAREEVTDSAVVQEMAVRISGERDRMEESVGKIKQAKEKYGRALEDFRRGERRSGTATWVLYFCISACVLLAAYVVWMEVRRKTCRKNVIVKALQPERERLQSMLSYDIDEDTREAIQDTISLLTGLLSEKDLTGSMSDRSNERIRRLAANKSGLMTALRMSYSLTEPAFVSKLQDYGLTDKEIGYCCLYASGLKGKDISFLLNNGGHGHYNIASTVRAKIGLRESDTNLSIYIRNMLRNK